jgi:hypothetical protein
VVRRCAWPRYPQTRYPLRHYLPKHCLLRHCLPKHCLPKHCLPKRGRPGLHRPTRYPRPPNPCRARRPRLARPGNRPGRPRVAAPHADRRKAGHRVGCSRNSPRLTAAARGFRSRSRNSDRRNHLPRGVRNSGVPRSDSQNPGIRNSDGSRSAGRGPAGCRRCADQTRIRWVRIVLTGNDRFRGSVRATRQVRRAQARAPGPNHAAGSGGSSLSHHAVGDRRHQAAIRFL